MKVTGTIKAFATMLEERGVYKKLRVSRITVATWKARLQENTSSVTLNKMEEMLTRYGATVVKEKVWNLPGKED